jgi:hypothetical protein
MAVPDASTWVRDQLRSYCIRRGGSLRGATNGSATDPMLVDGRKHWLVYEARQVVCRPDNHS